MHIKPLSTSFQSSLLVDPDKSLTHRAFLIALFARQPYTVTNPLASEDCLNTLQIVQTLGVQTQYSEADSFTTIQMTPPQSLTQPNHALYVGNSGTSIRLLSGVCAGLPFTSCLSGDQSILKRPMKRVLTPLSQMGAHIDSFNQMAPLTFHPSPLKPIEYHSPIASAQVKSCLLLAGLHCQEPGTLTVHEPHLSRNHTEKLLFSWGASLQTHMDPKEGTYHQLDTPVHLKEQDIFIPNDPSSAAFFVVLGLILPDCEIRLPYIGLNPSRIGFLTVLQEMGADIDLHSINHDSFEEHGTIIVRSSSLKGFDIPPEIVPNIIDEIPILAVAAAFAQGKTTFSGAQELRVKESDRIASTCQFLDRIGVPVSEQPDGFSVTGSHGQPLQGGSIQTFFDHRIAMSASVAGCHTLDGVSLSETQSVATSFPRFFSLLDSLR